MKNRRVLMALTTLVAALAQVPLFAAQSKMCGTVDLAGTPSFQSDGIANRQSNHFRWLSLPQSRLAILSSVGPEMPLDVAYYAGEPANFLAKGKLEGLLRVNLLSAAEDPAPWRLSCPTGEMFALEGKNWTTENVWFNADGKMAKITCKGGQFPWGHVEVPVPSLPANYTVGRVRFKVSRCDGAWALKIKDRVERRDYVIQGDTSQTGVFEYVLPADRHGDYELMLFCVGTGKSIWLESFDVELWPGSTSGDVSSAWYPSRIENEAVYTIPGNAPIQVKATDFFADTSTIVKRIDLEQAKGASAAAILVRLSGAARGTVLQTTGKAPAILFDQGDFTYAIAAAYKTDPAAPAKPVNLTAVSGRLGWSADIPLEVNGKTSVAVAFGFAAAREGKKAAARATAAAQGDWDEMLRKKVAAWDAALARVPAPQHFGIKVVDPMGVTPERHRMMYYAAWAYLIQNVLPPMPERNVRYPQVAAGKPGLYAAGPPRAYASAAWDSFFGQQFLAYIMPSVAWDAYEGLMSEVHYNGKLDGEELPSRKAQTAWILYSLTGDKDALQRVYPAIRRSLLWTEKRPRWASGDEYRTERDQGYVVSEIDDAAYAGRIAEVLGQKADVPMWAQYQERNLKKYERWFFFKDGRLPAWYYDEATGLHWNDRRPKTPGSSHILMIPTGLCLANLPPDVLKDLRRLVDHYHRPSALLAGYPMLRYPNASMIAHGMLERKMPQAGEFVSAVLRDAVGAKDFCREMTASGVRVVEGAHHAVLGACLVIEFTWLTNGMRMDQGEPQPLRE